MIPFLAGRLRASGRSEETGASECRLLRRQLQITVYSRKDAGCVYIRYEGLGDTALPGTLTGSITTPTKTGDILS